MTTIEEDKTVGKMVAEDYRKAEVFKRHGIDFCCGGNIPLAQACEEKNANIAAVQTELDEIDNRQAPPEEDYESWELDMLVDHIVGVHHVYVKKSNPTIKEFVNRVKMVHGMHKPNVTEISDRFDDLAQELDMHMHKEEAILFPYIKQMVAAKKAGTTLAAPFGTVENPINMMLMEHDSAGNELEIIQKLTEDYTPPKGACATHKVSYGQLKEYADDLMRHIHLENNILFPKALELEKELQNN
ncbi:MAG: iron-sulfur cluster repair di-iron protein [Crocinitomicaceae bacterium]|nr:iron-sulfur cluster repair di-iron protein [Crocinitomicaceae bacterium]